MIFWVKYELDRKVCRSIHVSNMWVRRGGNWSDFGGFEGGGDEVYMYSNKRKVSFV